MLFRSHRGRAAAGRADRIFLQPRVGDGLDAAARQREITLPLGGGKATKTLFIGEWEKPRNPVAGISPQGYTVRQAHNNITHAHYHQTEQWQVIVEGTGKLGRSAVAPVALHFTDPYTAYGPIVPEQEGLTYFTLRARSDPGACMLADQRAKEAIRPSKRRFILKDDLQISTADALRARCDGLVDRLAFTAMLEPDATAAIVRDLHGPR